MSQRDDRASVRHMLNHEREARDFTSGVTPEQFQKDRLLQLALTRLVEIVGEASTRVSPPSRVRFSTIPWILVSGMRNRLVHGYDAVDLKVLWDTVQDDFPPLIVELEKILNTIEASPP